MAFNTGNLIALLGTTIMMYCAGLLADHTGNMFTAAIFVVVCSLTFFIATFFLPETGGKKATTA